MKPAPFHYHAPRGVDEALALLSELGDDAKILAGGQSLMPAMNFRLMRPGHLVDLNRVAELSYVRVDEGGLRIGAMARQRTVERSDEVTAGWPLIGEALSYVGHTAIRNRGTLGGSLAHADPAAELPAVMAALDARLVVRGPEGERLLDPDDFFVTYLTTALEPADVLMEIRVPPLPPHTGWSFQEVSRRHGDFALVGAAALVTLGSDGAITRARLAFTGAAPRPVRSREAEGALGGQRPQDGVFREAGVLASRELDPSSDVHASAEYRREIGAVLAQRALAQAAERAARVLATDGR